MPNAPVPQLFPSNQKRYIPFSHSTEPGPTEHEFQPPAGVRTGFNSYLIHSVSLGISVTFPGLLAVSTFHVVPLSKSASVVWFHVKAAASRTNAVWKTRATKSG